MRLLLSLLALFAVTFAGCAEESAATQSVGDGFEDVVIETGTGLGVIRGVVVDQAIQSVADASVVLSGGVTQETMTDEQGRFIFTELEPGTYFLTITKYGYGEVQSSADVVADLAEPPIVKLQIERLYLQEPYSEAFKLNGIIVCSWDAGITAPCITDYSSILIPGGCCPELRSAQGDTREYQMAIGAGWESMVVEMIWEPSAEGTSPAMGGVMSYEGRLASHGYSRFEGESPLRVQVNEGAPGPGGDEAVPSEGLDNLLVFFGVRDGGNTVAVAINQEFEVFHHTFYHLEPPEDWSFVDGDPLPF